MLEKFEIYLVNEKLINIKDVEYRYIVTRKLLKKLRKTDNSKKYKLKREKPKTAKDIAVQAFNLYSDSDS